jgi:hypothetical protein
MKKPQFQKKKYETYIEEEFRRREEGIWFILMEKQYILLNILLLYNGVEKKKTIQPQGWGPKWINDILGGL